MNNKQRVGLAIGGGVIAIGAAVGVGAMAANLAGSADTAQSDPRGYGQGNDRTNRQRMDTSEMAAALATKLGVDETAAKTALDNALQTARPRTGGGTRPSGAPSGAPTGAAPSGAPGSNGQRGGNPQLLSAMATSIASELHLDQSTVLTALQEVWAEYGPGAGRPSAQPTS